MSYLNSFLVATAAVAALVGVGTANAIPAVFPTQLSENNTVATDADFLGAPDDTFFGLGGQNVTYDFGSVRIVNGAGNDFNIYEVDFGNVEFNLITVEVSLDGFAFVDVTASAGAPLDLDGDDDHGSASFRFSYDLGSLTEARFVRIDGAGTGNSGGAVGFDLDAIGAGNFRNAAIPVPSMLPAAAVAMIGLGFIARRRKG